MSYNISSLTPSRPAPTPPNMGRSPSGSSSYLSGTTARTNGSINGNSGAGKSQFSSTSYSSSFPIINPAATMSAPAPPTNATVRMGYANVKEEGLRSFLWSKRWLVLGGLEMGVYKNEVRDASQLTSGWPCSLRESR